MTRTVPFTQASMRRGDVVILPTEAQLIVGHLAVEQVPAMTLVNDHQIILVDGRRFGVVVSRAS